EVRHREPGARGHPRDRSICVLPPARCRRADRKLGNGEQFSELETVGDGGARTALLSQEGRLRSGASCAGRVFPEPSFLSCGSGTTPFARLVPPRKLPLLTEEGSPRRLRPNSEIAHCPQFPNAAECRMTAAGRGARACPSGRDS